MPKTPEKPIRQPTIFTVLLLDVLPLDFKNKYQYLLKQPERPELADRILNVLIQDIVSTPAGRLKVLEKMGLYYLLELNVLAKNAIFDIEVADIINTHQREKPNKPAQLEQSQISRFHQILLKNLLINLPYGIKNLCPQVDFQKPDPQLAEKVLERLIKGVISTRIGRQAIFNWLGARQIAELTNSFPEAFGTKIDRVIIECLTEENARKTREKTSPTPIKNSPPIHRIIDIQKN